MLNALSEHQTTSHQVAFPAIPSCTDKGSGSSLSLYNLLTECSHGKQNTSLPCQLFRKGQRFMEGATGKPYERTPWLAQTTVLIFVFHLILKTMRDTKAWGRSQLLPSCRFDTVRFITGHFSLWTYVWIYTVSTAMCILMGVTHFP